MAQVIPNDVRIATRDLSVPGRLTLSAGCPFLIKTEAIYKADPAIQQTGDWEHFRPERCALDP